MKKLICSFILLLFFFILASFTIAAWKFNPYTGKQDYYESAGASDFSDLTGTATDAQVPNDITIDLATLATTVTLTDNESTDENNPLWFSAGAAGSGSIGPEADGDAYYNPFTSTLTAPKFTASNSTGNGGLEIDPLPDTDDTCEGIIETVTAGTTVAFGELVGLQVADGEFILADADAGIEAVAVACEAGTDGNSMEVMTSGFVRDDGRYAFTIGNRLYLGDTAGATVENDALPQGSEDLNQEVGVAITADIMLFDPQDPKPKRGLAYESYTTTPQDLDTDDPKVCRKVYIMGSTTDAALEFDLQASGLCDDGSFRELYFINNEDGDYDLIIDPNASDTIRIRGGESHTPAACSGGAPLYCDDVTGDGYSMVKLMGRSSASWDAIIESGLCSCTQGDV